MPLFVPASVTPQAEFDFTQSLAAQRLKILRLQFVFAGLVALFIFLISQDALVCGWLELILLLVFLRARRGLLTAPVVERLVVAKKSASATINGRHHPLSSYRLDYFSHWLALIQLTTVAGQRYHCCVFADLLGVEKYRHLLAVLKATSQDVES
ncbi:MAG: hypothetical protein KBT88_00010 [Gammaproteobacteria bacterium]|nr:hypothetical protein [Gammaproteobacteria bacterium]MBQ0838140.1 hypothetical protein [Gammaproteobacteria bacterium]